MRQLLLFPFSMVVLASACAPQMHFTRDERARVNAITAAKPEDRAPLRAEMAAIHSEWSAEIQQAVELGELLIGMDYHQAVATWGMPDRRQVYLISGADREYWTYRLTSPPIRVFLIHGRVERVSYDHESPSARPEVPKGTLGYRLQPPL